MGLPPSFPHCLSLRVTIIIYRNTKLIIEGHSLRKACLHTHKTQHKPKATNWPRTANAKGKGKNLKLKLHTTSSLAPANHPLHTSRHRARFAHSRGGSNCNVGLRCPCHEVLAPHGPRVTRCDITMKITPSHIDISLVRYMQGIWRFAYAGYMEVCLEGLPGGFPIRTWPGLSRYRANAFQSYMIASFILTYIIL